MKTFMMISALTTAAFVLPATASAQQTPNDSMPVIDLKVAQSIGLKKALQIASKETAGKIVEAESDSFDGIRVYEVDMLDGKTVRQVRINAQSGNIISVRSKRLSSLVNRLIEDEDTKAARNSNISLLDYLVAVEQKTGGEVTEINLDSEKSGIYIEVTTVKDGIEQEITVDPKTGNIVMGDFD